MLSVVRSSISGNVSNSGCGGGIISRNRVWAKVQSLTYNPVYSSALLCKVWSADEQEQHHMRGC